MKTPLKLASDYYDLGWNDAIDNKPKQNNGRNYRDGYSDCKEAIATGAKVEKI